MPAVRQLCVYCGSSGAVAPAYREAASELGLRLAASRIGLVFGGGRIGLMGLVADAVLAGGGEATGIIPAHLRDRELAHEGVTRMIVVDSMHERKRLMAERADAFAILPGGIGTLDELFEALSWKQLALHDKPIFILDIAQYWAPLFALLDAIVESGFASAQAAALMMKVPSVSALMEALARPPQSRREARPERF
jgi:uncharacterized protein (TIGR00730 family)